ncbi:hypothetical protein [Tropicibacter alexandrii]|uniref:hypothetical protein n=1 Tax=Tropicibacter alexandrii TaxID=2267683 RepID=UPI000EF47559|nr:hypothetical protein [Tropicibacter alexandrii]
MAKDLEKPKVRPAGKLDHDAPRLALEMGDDGVLKVDIPGQWGRIMEASRNWTVLEGLVAHVTHLGAEGQKHDQQASNFALGFVDAMEPRDPAEMLLLTQMAATHQAVMMMARHLNHTKTIQQKDCAEKAFNKTARTFATQMETLKRYRSKGQQVVRVERVTVEAGAQAVVGNVEAGGGTNL